MQSHGQIGRSRWMWALVFVLAGVPTAMSQGGVKLFPLSDVRVTGGPFKHAQDLNLEQLMLYDPDRLLAPFLTEAGLTPKGEYYPNWEATGLGGHTAGHYLSALSLMYASTGDTRCSDRLTYMIDELERCQNANGNGYAGGVPDSAQLWAQIAAGNINASAFSLNNRWVPWYNLHKTFAGLRDAWLVAGNQKARTILIGFADWVDNLVAGLSDQQIQSMLNCEQGGMNEVLADVAKITGDNKYLTLAERFSHQAILTPLAQEQDQLTGLHANTQVPKIIGFAEIGEMTGDPDYQTAASFFWDTVVHNRSLAFGGNSISEHFPALNQSEDWLYSREGPETCNTYNMLRLTEKLFAEQPNAEYADFYERAMMNHILSTQHPDHGGYVYFTPARMRHYRVYSQVEQAFWCCVGSGMENHSKYGEFIYAHDDANDALYVNLFMPSVLTWADRGLILTQDTTFPDEPRTQLTFGLTAPQQLTLKVRYPEWVAAGALQITINGTPWSYSEQPGSYVAIDRHWMEGDVVQIELPMQIHTVSLPNLSEYVALMYGPVMLASATGTEDLDGLLAGTGRMEHVANGPLEPIGDAPMLAPYGNLADMIVPVPDEPLTFTAAAAIEPSQWDSLELIPFFRLHDARYMMYWRLVAPEDIAEVISELREEERVALALDKATIDRVAPGEQQPEVEHNFQGESTWSGVYDGRLFRHAEGWFSYDMNAGEYTDVDLYVTYYGSDVREFKILINGELLEQVSLNAPAPGEFISKRYPIPLAMLQAAQDGLLTVRFEAEPGSIAGGIFDVRLIKRESMATTLVSDTGNDRVLKFSMSAFGEWEPDVMQPVFAEGVLGSAALDSPVGMAKDSLGHVFIAEGNPTHQNRVLQFDLDGNYQATIAENGASGASDDFSGTPTHIAVDPTDTYVFMSVAQTNSTATEPQLQDVIYRIRIDGTAPPEVYISTAGSGGAYELNDPQGLEFGPDGCLYVCNNQNQGGGTSGVLSLTNGDFQTGAYSSDDINVDGWFDGDRDTDGGGANFWEDAWHIRRVTPNGTAALALSNFPATSDPADGSWAYQSLGTDASVTSLAIEFDWGTFTDAVGDEDVGLTMSVYESDGSFSAGQNVDIEGASGVTLLARQSISALNVGVGTLNTAVPMTFDLSSQTGGELFLRINNFTPSGADGGNGAWCWVDNLSLSMSATIPGSQVLRFDVSGQAAFYNGALTTMHSDMKGLYFDGFRNQMLVSVNSLNDIWAYTDLTQNLVSNDPANGAFKAVYEQDAVADYPDVAFAHGDVYFTDRMTNTVRRVDGVNTLATVVDGTAGLNSPHSLLVINEIDPFDFDNDGDVDAADQAIFMGAVSGPNNTTIPAGIDVEQFLRADIDDDGDVDLRDAWVFFRCVTN